MRNLIRMLVAWACRLYNRLSFARNHVQCLTDLDNINGILRIVGVGRIVIGERTRINSGARRNPIGGDVCVTLVCRSGGTIEIGEGCGLSNCTIVADQHVKIESEALIGGGVKIYDTDFHSLDPEIRRVEKRGRYYGKSKPVIVGRNAFIGAHSILLKGAAIGENSVIGAGSVVSGPVPANEIWAGNPARYVRAVD